MVVPSSPQTLSSPPATAATGWWKNRALLTQIFEIILHQSLLRQTASKLGVVVGSHNRNSEDPEQESFALTRIKLHEDYDSNTISNDICLLFLDGEADFSSDVIGAIALPESMEEYEAGTECVVSGEDQSFQPLHHHIICTSPRLGYNQCRRLPRQRPQEGDRTSCL